MTRLAFLGLLALCACGTSAGGSGASGMGNSGTGHTGASGSTGSGTGSAGTSGGSTGAAGGAGSLTGATGAAGSGSGAAAGSGSVSGSGAGSTGATGTAGAAEDAGAAGDAGASGSSGVAGSVPIECTPDAGGGPVINPTIEMIVHGTNGTLASTCDAQGNLSEPECESMLSCGPGPNPGCVQNLTGNAVTQTVDCAGHCVNGACDGRCPVAGDPFHCVSADGDGGVAIVDDANQRSFDCTIVFSAPSYDCVQGIQANVQGTLQGFTASNAIASGGAVYCTGKSFGNVDVRIAGVTLPAPYQNENCTIACSVAP